MMGLTNMSLEKLTEITTDIEKHAADNRKELGGECDYQAWRDVCMMARAWYYKEEASK